MFQGFGQSVVLTCEVLCGEIIENGMIQLTLLFKGWKIVPLSSLVEKHYQFSPCLVAILYMLDEGVNIHGYCCSRN